MLTQWLVENPVDDPDWPGTRLVIERLVADPRAHDALKAIAKNKPMSDSYGIESPSGAVWELVDQCYRAVDQLEMFHDLLAGERKAVEQLQRHRQSVADLRQFIAAAGKPHQNPYVDWSSLQTTTDPNEVAEHAELCAKLNLGPISIAYEKGADYNQDALDRIAALIEERQQSTDRVYVSSASTENLTPKRPPKPLPLAGWQSKWMTSSANPVHGMSQCWPKSL